MGKTNLDTESKIPAEVIERLEAEIEQELKGDIEALSSRSKGLTLAQIEAQAMVIRQRFGERLMERILAEQEGGKLAEKKMYSGRLSRLL